MPKIRKETSNRRSTNDRAKLRKKIKEGRKKKKRDAKKNVQWKSKAKKDPGIPSEFPYKDQILAEVAEQRRLAAEEKEKKKLEKQRALAKARAIAKGEPFEDSDAEDSAEGHEEDDDAEIPKDLNVGAESIASLSAKFITTELKPRPQPAAQVEEEDEEEDEVPVLINRDLPNLKSVLEKADVVLEVVDGRDPLVFRSRYIEQIATDMGKKVLLVLNKIDMCPREAISSWSQQLRTQQPTLIFRAASSFLPETSSVVSQPPKNGKSKAKIPVNDAVGADSLLECLSQWSKDKKEDKLLVVAVVGVTNVGKSSLINSLLQRSALPVYTLTSSSRGPTTTDLPQEVTLEVDEQTITLIDTPGFSFLSEKDGDESQTEDSRARDILIRNKGRIDRLKDCTPPIAHIVSRASTEDLMLMYNLAAFTKGDSTAFLSGVARANQLLKKKGELDLTGASRIVLRDWNIGKLLHYTTPPTTTPLPTDSLSTKSPAHESFVDKLYDNDESILASIPTRKERRKAGGLVKMSPSVMEERSVAVEQDWAGVEDSEDEESDDDDAADIDAEGMDVDEEDDEEEQEKEEDDEDEDDQDGDEEKDEDEEEEEDEQEEMTPPPPVSNKQKRKRALETVAPERPSKKVAFAAQPSKHSRSKQSDTPNHKHTPNPPTQKPLKSAQAPSKESEKSVSSAKSKPSSKLKASSTSKKSVVKSPLEGKSRVANVVSKKPQASATTSKKKDSGPEVYDFGKFF